MAKIGIKGNLKMKLRTEKKTHTVEICKKEETGIFEVSPMTPRETDKLLKKFTTHEKHKGQVMPVTDFVGFMVAKTKKVISGWNIEDENGNPLDCTDENKELIYMLNPSVISKVIEEADKIASGDDEIRAETEKN